jgi:hypothetical protein
MTMIVVDSSIWIDHFRNELTPAVRWLRTTSNASQIIVGDVVMLEVLRGARNDPHAATIREALGKFRQVAMLTPERSARAAANYRALRSLGVTTRSAMDIIIATYCIDSGHQLLHGDRDFGGYEQHLNLRVFRPA